MNAYLIQWARFDDRWYCEGPLSEDTGLVITQTKYGKMIQVLRCDKNKDEEPYFSANMVAGTMDDDGYAWERWWLPPGVHPKEVQAFIKKENDKDAADSQE